MNVWDHLGELRRRLLICVYVLVAGTIAGAWAVNPLLDWLARPVGILIFVQPMEAFTAQVKIALGVSFLLTLPVLLYQAWAFVATGLTAHEKRSLHWVVPLSYVLFMGGFSFSTFIVFPKAVAFLLTLRSRYLEPMLSVGAYLDMFYLSGLVLGFLFQLPLALLFLSRVGLLQPDALTRNRRISYLAIFILAAIFNTGPDAFTQLLFAFAAIVLFELSIVWVRWEAKKRPST
ncbi:MAG: twin arginine-targeting protein translocase TatC [Elusimicrobia bacterium RIFCSPLOWO2_01_FULL_59_12]|nr:MAG: twin arginine-targeting protein translocase TatC [Elusimicrobia bacterium RIFCSPLOWO2_01_FULL_59_12]